MSGHLSGAADFIQQRAIENFSKCDPEYGRRLREALNKYKKLKVKELRKKYISIFTFILFFKGKVESLDKIWLRRKVQLLVYLFNF